jgi:hypothetical protein
MRLALGTALVLLFATAAEAQLCTGNPSYTSNPYQVGLNAAFTDGAHGVSGDFGAGGEAFFASAGVGVINFRDLDETATQVSATAGAELGQFRTVFICPIASVSVGIGPDIGDIDVSTFSVAGGGSVGVIASQTDSLMIVPSFGLAAVYNRFTAEIRGDDVSESDSSGRASIGVGFIFNQHVGISPALIVPFSAGNDDPIFEIRLSFGFGR